MAAKEYSDEDVKYIPDSDVEWPPKPKEFSDVQSGVSSKNIGPGAALADARESLPPAAPNGGAVPNNAADAFTVRLAQRLSLGTGPHARAAVLALRDKLVGTGTGDFHSDYAQHLQEWNNQTAADQTAHPNATHVADLVGYTAQSVLPVVGTAIDRYATTGDPVEGMKSAGLGLATMGAGALAGKAISGIGSGLSKGGQYLMKQREEMIAKQIAERQAEQASARGLQSQAVGELQGIAKNAPGNMAVAPDPLTRAQWQAAGQAPPVKDAQVQVAANLPDRINSLNDRWNTPIPPDLPHPGPVTAGQALKAAGSSALATAGPAVGGVVGGAVGLSHGLPGVLGGGLLGAGVGKVAQSAITNPTTKAFIGQFGYKLGMAIDAATKSNSRFGQMLQQAATQGAQTLAATHYAASALPDYQMFLKTLQESDQPGNVR